MRATGAKRAGQKKWEPVSDRKVRVGIVGYGVCQFGAAFGFQDHPNVEIVAVSDLIPQRCKGLMEACRCAKSYESLEELVKDPKIEAVFVATDAASHARHCIEVLNHGKHVMTAVPAVLGSIEDAEKLLETVKKTGLKYMMAETSCYREDCCAMRQIYRAGGFGRLVYSEGEYYHFSPTPIDSLQGLADRPAAHVVSHALHGLLRRRHRQAAHLRLRHRLQRRIPRVPARREQVRKPVHRRGRPVRDERGRLVPHAHVQGRPGGHRRDRPGLRRERLDERHRSTRA